MTLKLKRGTPIVYIPTHLLQDFPTRKAIYHKDSQMGFVWEDRIDTIACRYWNLKWGTLRTRSNSEVANRENIFLLEDYHPTSPYTKKLIDAWITILEFEEEFVRSNLSQP